VNIIDTLIALHDEAAPDTGARAAFTDAMRLIETIENLNVLAWKMVKLRDEAEEADLPPEFRHSYLEALDTAHRIVLEMRIDDE
jgi:hypothetical protein